MSWEIPNLKDSSFLDQLISQGSPWLTAMAECPQDTLHHGEGSVLNHVRMVYAELLKNPKYQALDPTAQTILAWTAILHDVGKPRCTVHRKNGRISSPGHANKGAQMARIILWERGCPFALREEICGLIANHMRLFWVFDKDRPEHEVRKISQRCRCDYLSLQAESDARGRICQDEKSLLEKVELFEELAKELDCMDKPAEFASDTGRFLYFKHRWHNPEYPPHEDFRNQVILMSGLPGCGKDTWIRDKGPGWPVVSLDAIRRQFGLDASGQQGQVLAIAREKAKEYLRKGEPFIWNATCLSRRVRGQTLSLFFEYGAQVEIVYLDAPIQAIQARNRDREHSVPWSAIGKMLRHWEVPTVFEAHSLRIGSEP